MPVIRRRQPTLAESVERMLRVGHDFWERHQHSPDSDEMSAALTDLHFALKRDRGAVAENERLREGIRDAVAYLRTGTSVKQTIAWLDRLAGGQ